MATELGKAYVQIVPSAQGISGKISGMLSGEVGSAGASLGSKLGSKIVGVASKVFAAAGIGKVIKDSIMEGGKLQQSIGGVKTLFTGGVKEMLAYSKQAYKHAGVSANEFMEQATSFGAALMASTGKNGKKSADLANMAIRDMSDNANKMGTNLVDIQNAYQGFAKQNFTMLDNLKLGFAGNKEGMQQLLAEAEKLTGKKFDINKFSDIVEAVHAVQKSFGIAGTTAEEARTTLTGSFNMMKASWKDLLGEIAIGGNDLGPKLQNVIQSAITFAFGNLVPMIGRVLVNLPKAIAGAFTILAPQMVAQGKKLMDWLGIGISSSSPLATLLSNLQNNLAPVIGAFKTAFGQIPSALRTVGQALFPVIETIAGALGKMKFDGIADLVKAVIPALSNAFNQFMSIAGPAISTVANSFTNLWNTAQPLISVIAGALKPAFEVLASFLGGVVKGALTALAGTFDFLAMGIKFFTPIIQTVVEHFKSMTPIFDLIAEGIGVLVGVFGNFGQIGKGVGQVIKSAWDNMKTTFEVTKMVAIDIINAIKAGFTALGEGGNILRNVIKGAWNGIKSAIKVAGDTIKWVLNGIKNFFSNLGSAGNVLRGVLSGAWNGIRSVVMSTGSAIISKANAIKNVFNSFKKINLFSAGAALIKGLWNGISSMAGWIYSKISGFCSGIASKVRALFGIHSPSRVFAEIGGYLSTGLAQGITDKAKVPLRAVESMAKDLSGVAFDSIRLPEAQRPNPLDFRALKSTEVKSRYTLDSDMDRANRVDKQLTAIYDTLNLILDKDTDVYMDGRKVGAQIEPIIRMQEKVRTKYTNRREGLIFGS